jgi:hypothetical protein
MKKLLKKYTGIESIQNLISLNREKINELEKKIDEIYWANVFNNSINNSQWLKIKTFNPGRWAAGYQMLYILYRVYDIIKPQNIIEFGLGESSKISYQYYKTQKAINYIIIEHDKEWLNFFPTDLFDIKPNTTLLELETTTINNYKTIIYKDLIKTIKNRKFDFIIIDGPFGSEHFSRHQMIDLLNNNNISDDFILLLDDYNRQGEKETINEFLILLDKKGIEYYTGIYSGIKDTFLICSKKYRFLTSL